MAGVRQESGCGASLAFGTAATVQTVAAAATDRQLDALVVLQPTAALTTPAATVHCAWSTRPTRFFSTHITALGVSDDPSLHAETLSVLGSATAGTAADVVCAAATTGGATLTAAVAVTAVQVNGHAVVLGSNT